MSIHFQHPLLLLVLLGVGGVGIVTRVALGRSAAPRRALWTALYLASVGLLAVALAQPQVRSSARPPTVLVIDRSASVDANLRDTETRWAAAARRADCPQPCRVIRFTGTAQPVAPTAAGLNGGATPSDGSNLSAALDAALARVPNQGRIVVLSDGWTTGPAVRGQIAAARLQHVSIDSVTLSDPKFRYAAVTQVQAPSAVHAGDAVPLRVTVRSSVTEPATLYLIHDRTAVGEQTINLRPGDNPLLLSYTAPRAGWHSYQVRVVLFSDDLAQNNERGAAVDVVAPPRVLVVSQGGSAAIPATLSRLGFTVTGIRPGALPGAGSGLAGEDAVVLDDVPATAMSTAQMSALSTAVRLGGLGVLALGGPHSFSLGRYAHTPLDTLLPVSSLVPGNLQRKNVAIELVLDHSGSMIDLAGGVPKIEMVHVAGVQTARFVGAHHDALGVVDFDIAPHVLVPMQTLTRSDEQRVVSAVSRLQANGGTNIYAGLEAGLRELQRSSAPDKHLILMTDGIGQPENYTPLLSELSRAHIQVATVALGTDADKSLLYDIAKATGGHYYYTDNAHRLPLIFGKETRFDVKPVKVSGRLGVTAGSDSPVVRSLAGHRLPPLTGNVVTNLKSGAQADLLAAGTGSQSNPAMAEWQYGAGRVVAFTPGLGPPWASAWSGETALVNDAVRWAQRGVSTAPLIPTVIEGAPPSLALDLGQSPRVAALHPSQISGTLTSDTGQGYPVVLRSTGPAQYEASLPGLTQGIYRYTLDAGASPAASTSGLVAVPYSMEYTPRPADATSLGPLPALTGGRALAAGDPGVLARGGWRSVWWISALAGGLLFLAGALGRTLERPLGEGPDGRRNGGGHGNGDGNGAGNGDGRYRVTRPADLAASASTSSGETSVRART